MAVLVFFVLVAIMLVANGNMLDKVQTKTVQDVPGLTDEMLIDAFDEAKIEQDEMEKRTPRVNNLGKLRVTLQSQHYERSVPELEPARIHAMVMERTTRKLANKLGMTEREASKVLKGLKSRYLEFKRTSIRFRCYFANPYRTIDGSCNNLFRPKLGAANTAFSRILEPDYEDGVSKPRVAKDGKPLPNARNVSLSLFSDVNATSPKLSHMCMVWGQFIDHDVDHAASQDINCAGTCGLKGECFGIPIPEGDETFRSRGVKCIQLKRNTPIGGGKIKPRDQVNTKTSFIDASQLYGDSEKQFNEMRVTESGMLLEKPNPAGSKYKNLLPKQPEGEFCRSSDPVAKPCFLSGDFRVNENAGLASMHTIWSHEHNRLVTQLRKLNPHWDATRLYFEARKIVGALMQHITYNEFLPLILDEDTRRRFKLKLREHNHYYGYSAGINPSIFNSFAGSAYRFGHSLVQNQFNRFLTGSTKPVDPPINMNRFFDPSSLYDVKHDGVDSILRGLAKDPSQKIDGYFAKAVQEELTREPGDLSDLPAINIQRGRDHGLPGYNAYRKLCGLKRAESFDDFNDIIPPKKIEKLKNIYKHPEDVDLFVGGMLELPTPTGIIGRTFSSLLAIQFWRLRHGDRFWYENNHCWTGFTTDQLTQLRNASLARVICDNGDNIAKIQKRVLSLSSKSNPVVGCAYLPRVDLNKWIEIPGYKRRCLNGWLTKDVS